MSRARALRTGSPLEAAVRACRSTIVGIVAMSAVLNVLTLSGAFFMPLVYDTVLPAHSVPTLVCLGIILAVLYVFQGALDFLRARILAKIGASVEVEVGDRVFDSIGRRAAGVWPWSRRRRASVLRRSGILIRCAASSPAAAQPPLSTCRGWCCFWPSVSCST
jgi:ABC-type protease/lipase transport system fused ATPase/permease subunit